MQRDCSTKICAYYYGRFIITGTKEFEKAINYIHKLLPDTLSMIRVVPESEIGKYLSFEYDLYKYMIRKADFDYLINGAFIKLNMKHYTMLLYSTIIGHKQMHIQRQLLLEGPWSYCRSRQ